MSKPEEPDSAELFLGLKRAATAEDAATEAEQRAWAECLAPLDEGLNEPLPDHLWSGLEARLDQEHTLPGITTFTADAGTWEPIGAGISRKLVHLDADGSTICYFLRLDEGATLPGHGHTGDEHCVVLEGQLQMGDTVFGKGSYQLARSGVRHPPITALTPALLYLQGSLQLAQ